MLLIFIGHDDILGNFHLFELLHVELVLFREEAQLLLVSDVQFIDIDMFQTIEQRLELEIIIMLNSLLDFLSLFCVISRLASFTVGVSTILFTCAISADKSAQRC